MVCVCQIQWHTCKECSLQEASKPPLARCSKIAGLGPLVAKKPDVTE